MSKTKISAKLVGLTHPVGIPASTAEELIAYAARVSNPSNQANHSTADRLLRYCVDHKHWSVFEMANAVVEVKGPRDITRQLLRHRSFSFQEFSQRYSDEIEFTSRSQRRQDTKNRQNSTDNLEAEVLQDCYEMQDKMRLAAETYYKAMREAGVAKETARVILPEGLTMSTLYVNGTIRSWLHYLDVRDDEGVTQWEHVELARAVRGVLEPVLPTILNMGK